jgi:hypothetical protein
LSQLGTVWDKRVIENKGFTLVPTCPTFLQFFSPRVVELVKNFQRSAALAFKSQHNILSCLHGCNELLFIRQGSEPAMPKMQIVQIRNSDRPFSSFWAFYELELDAAGVLTFISIFCFFVPPKNPL